MTMSPFDSAVVFVADRLPGFDDDRRHDLVATARQAAADGGRLAEVGSLVALWLRLRAQRTSYLLLRGAALGLVLAVAVGAAPFPVAVAVAVPVALVALGWLDPRYAAAATVIWAWRFVAGGFGDYAFLRLLAMAVGILLAVTVAQASWRRLTLR